MRFYKYPCSEELLRELYLDEKKSMREIAELLEVPEHRIYRAVKRYGIPTRSRSEATKLVTIFRGNTNPRYQGDNCSVHAGHLRAQRLFKLDYCKLCGETAGMLRRHHVDKDTSNNDPSNVVVLCSLCHTQLHFGKLPEVEGLFLPNKG